MKTRLAPVLFLLALLLAAFVPAAGAQTARPARPQAAPQGDRTRAERHPHERPTRPTARTAPDYRGLAPAADSAPALAAPTATNATTTVDDAAVVRASVDNFGQQGNDDSYEPAITPDGRFVAFVSYADDLVSLDWNDAPDIFVRDTQTNTVERVSVSSSGDESDEASFEPVISADGRYVAFYSYANNLVDDDANDVFADIFLHDRQTATTTIVSRSSDGTQGNSDSFGPGISADGRFIVYSSYSDNLVDGDANGDLSDVFVFDRQTDTTTLISRSSDGTQGDDESYRPAISADGRIVAFTSYADNLVAGASGDFEKVFAHDLQTGDTTFISRSTGGTPANSYSFDPAISADGRLVAFMSEADNLVADDANGDITDIFVHDRQTGTTTLVSRHSDGTQSDYYSYAPDLSDDGQFVSYDSEAHNLVDDEADYGSAIFLTDLDTGETTLVSRSATGIPGNGYSVESSLSADGQIVAFFSSASNLADFYTGFYQITVRYTGVTLHTISGRVTDTADNDLEGIAVHDISGAAVYTGSDGSYVLAGLLPGDHGVWAWDDSAHYLFPYAPEAVALPPDATGVDIVGTENTLQQLSFTATADATVDQIKKAANFGTKDYLNVRSAPSGLSAYLRFDVDGLTCAPAYDASLGLYAQNAGPDGGTVYATGNDWTETGITWSNAPAAGEEMGAFGRLTDNAYNLASVWDVDGNRSYSYVVSSDANKLIKYDSREGANTPYLNVEYYEQSQRAPDAQFSLSPDFGLVPLTVYFSDESTGCPTAWEWDFGDGTTSSAQNPTHTYTTPGEYQISLTITNSMGTDRLSRWVDAVAPPTVFDISASGSGTIGGIGFTGADVLRYDQSAETWSMIYDGSVRGTPKNISSLAWDENGEDLLLSFSANQTIAGLGTATPFDVVRFTPDTPGVFPLGPGTYAWEVRGKDHYLTTSTEKIDAIDFLFGDMLFSTKGPATVTTLFDETLKVKGNDLLIWYGFDQSWSDSPLLVGSTVPGLEKEDINGVWYDPEMSDIYITLRGAFDLGGVTGNGKSIIRLEWTPDGYNPQTVDWLSSGGRFPSTIDAIALGR